MSSGAGVSAAQLFMCHLEEWLGVVRNSSGIDNAQRQRSIEFAEHLLGKREQIETWMHAYASRNHTLQPRRSDGDTHWSTFLSLFAPLYEEEGMTLYRADMLVGHLRNALEVLMQQSPQRR